MFKNSIANVSKQALSTDTNARELTFNTTLAMVLIVAITFPYINYLSIHHDLAGGILSGKLAFELGEKYEIYSLYFPPAEKIWFSTIAYLHDITHVRLDYITIALTSILVIFSTNFAYQIRKKTVGASLLFLVIPVLTFSVLPILNMNIFGLREHLVVLGFWPYLVYRLSAPSENRLNIKWRIALGLWMGFALTFKFLYAIVVLLIELVDTIYERNPLILFRIESLISGAIVAFYLLFWLVLDPSNYASLSVIKSGLDANLKNLEDNIYHIGKTFFYAVPLILIGLNYKLNKRHFLICLAILVSTIAIAAVQGRWYSHHYFPIFLAYVAFVWLVSNKIPKIIYIFICVLLLSFMNSGIKQMGYHKHQVSILKESLLKNGASLKDQKIGLFTAHPSPFNQVITELQGTRWIIFPNISHVASELKTLDTIKNHGVLAQPVSFSNQAQKEIQAKLMHLWEDIPPDVIILDHSTSWPLEHLRIKWDKALSKEKKFVEIMKNYNLKYTHSEQGLHYDFYIRKN